ncbi:MAG: V-type ATP synthase subunit E family protein [Candidatus Methanofastidiosia archaeon]
MTLEEIKKDIKKKARLKVEQALKEGEREAQEIIEDAKRRALEIERERMERAREEMEKLRQRELSNVKLEVKKARFKVEREILEKVLSESREDFLKDSSTILKKLLKAVNGEKIYSNEKDENTVRRLSEMEYGGNIVCSGGIVVENEDGTLREDLTFDTMISEVNSRALKKVFDALFR